MPSIRDLPSALWNGLGKVVSMALLRDDTLHVHAFEFNAPKYDLNTVKFEKFDELRFVTQNPVAGGFRLRTFWKTDPDPQRLAAFQAEHEKHGQPWRAPAGADEVKGDPRWRLDWAKLIAWCVTTLAGLLWANAAAWIAYPDVKEGTADKVARNFLDTAPALVEFDFRNDHPSAPCKIVFDEPVIRREGKVLTLKVDKRPADYDDVKPGGGDSKKFEVSVRLADPGAYEIRIDGKATAGWVPALVLGPQPVMLSRRVTIWREAAIPKDTRVAKANGAAPVIKCVLLTGRKFEDGLDIQATLAEQPGLRLSGVKFPGGVLNAEEICNLAPGRESASFAWRTSRLDEFHAYEFDLYVKDQRPHDYAGLVGLFCAASPLAASWQACRGSSQPADLSDIARQIDFRIQDAKTVQP
jgi:hypothetical protein